MFREKAGPSNVPAALPWFPRWRYRPGGPPSEPALREAWELGRAQQPIGRSCPTREQMEQLQRLSPRERDAYLSGVRTGVDEPRAPVGLSLAVVLVAIEAGIEVMVGDRLPRVVCAMPVSVSVDNLRSELDRRRAWRRALQLSGSGLKIRSLLAITQAMSVVQLLVPVARSSLGGEIEQIPERLDGANMTRLLPAVRWGVQKL